MSKKLFIASFLVYKTPGEKAKGAFSAGLAVASRLNGNIHLVGSYRANQDDEANRRKVGFITFREKFKSEEEADEFRAVLKAKYLVGSTLNPREWAWGEIDEDNTLALNSPGAVVHFVEYVAHNAEVEADAKRELQFEGKVTEPVEA